MTNSERSELLDRITYNPGIFGGKAIIRGRRLSVEHILENLAMGESAESILEGFQWLEPADIQACLLYGAIAARHARFTAEFLASVD